MKSLNQLENELEEILMVLPSDKTIEDHQIYLLGKIRCEEKHLKLITPATAGLARAHYCSAVKNWVKI